MLINAICAESAVTPQSVNQSIN